MEEEGDELRPSHSPKPWCVPNFLYERTHHGLWELNRYSAAGPQNRCLSPITQDPLLIPAG